MFTPRHVDRIGVENTLNVGEALGLLMLRSYDDRSIPPAGWSGFTLVNYQSRSDNCHTPSGLYLGSHISSGADRRKAVNNSSMEKRTALPRR